MTGKFKVGPTQHNVLFGFDFTQFYTGYHTLGNWDIPNTGIPGRDSDKNPNTDLTIDIHNPRASYGINPALYRRALGIYPPNPGNNFSMFKDQWFGLYFQDQITLWDKLHILGGGRYDWADAGRGMGNSYATATDALDNRSLKNLREVEGFSPRVGILYEPWHFLSVYGNWTTSFNANNSPAANGKIFDPERGEQFEAGVKTSLFDDKLLATLAYYHLTKDNILVDNILTTKDANDKISNVQRSQGIELDVTGQITDELSLIGNYAYTDAKVTKDFVTGTTGNRLPNVADHSGSLWLKYDHNGFDSPHGFSFGVGAFAASARQGDFTNSFQMPGYVRMDVFGAYKLKFRGAKITTQINIRNILDKTYYESTDPEFNVAPALAIAPGAPLTAIGSIRVEY